MHASQPWTPASAWARIRAFAWDYLAIVAYLVSLSSLGAWLTLGPLKDSWAALMSTPTRVDLMAFLVSVLPVTLYFAISESSRGATWGKHKVGLRVCTADGSTPPLRQTLIRAAVKFLPWQLAHTAMLHIPGFPLAPVELPTWTMAVLALVWSLVALYLVGLTRFMQGQTLYDRLSGVVVVNAER